VKKILLSVLSAFLVFYIGFPVKAIKILELNMVRSSRYPQVKEIENFKIYEDYFSALEEEIMRNGFTLIIRYDYDEHDVIINPNVILGRLHSIKSIRQANKIQYFFNQISTLSACYNAEHESIPNLIRTVCDLIKAHFCYLATGTFEIPEKTQFIDFEGMFF